MTERFVTCSHRFLRSNLAHTTQHPQSESIPPIKTASNWPAAVPFAPPYRSGEHEIVATTGLAPQKSHANTGAG